MAALKEADVGTALSFISEKFANLYKGALHMKAGLSDRILSFFPNKNNVGLQVSAAESAKNEAYYIARRQQLLTKMLSACLGLAFSLTVSYFSIKWLARALDLTRHEKKEAQEKAQKLMRRIGIKPAKLTEYELYIASNLVDPLGVGVSWNDIGGLASTIEELQETVILPFKRRELFADSSLLQPPKGILLYGPPGCGKTMIAKATAQAAGACFINLQVSSIFDKWYGESQKRVEAIFSLAEKIQPTIIFIDEIDSFLRSRNANDHEVTAQIKTQFMTFWDGLTTGADSSIMIIGATNRPQDVDVAIMRRMPCMFHICLPETEQRANILQLILRDEPVGADVDTHWMASKTDGFSGSDLRELCRCAAIFRIRDYLSQERSNEYGESRSASSTVQLRPIERADFEEALRKMKRTRLLAGLSLQQPDLD